MISDKWARSGGLRSVGIGIAVLAFGGVLTAATHAAAGPGETYFVTTGAYLCGAMLVIRGVARLITG